MSLIESLARRGQHALAVELCGCMHNEPNAAGMREGVLMLLKKLQAIARDDSPSDEPLMKPMMRILHLAYLTFELILLT